MLNEPHHEKWFEKRGKEIVELKLQHELMHSNTLAHSITLLMHSQ